MSSSYSKYLEECGEAAEMRRWRHIVFDLASLEVIREFTAVGIAGEEL